MSHKTIRLVEVDDGEFNRAIEYDPVEETLVEVRLNHKTGLKITKRVNTLNPKWMRQSMPPIFSEGGFNRTGYK